MVYLWGISQRRFKEKTICKYTQKLSAGEAPKVTKLSGVFRPATQTGNGIPGSGKTLMSVMGANVHGHMKYIVDFCPAILAKRPRSKTSKSHWRIVWEKLQLILSRMVLWRLKYYVFWPARITTFCFYR